MKYFHLKFLFCWFFLIFFSNSFGQSLDRNKTISAYIYNISKHVEWKNENEIEVFKILVISDDLTTKKSFENISNSTNIKGKTVEIIQISSLINFDNSCQIVFISESKNMLYSDLYNKVVKKPILIISENYSDKKYSMVNLYDSPDRKLLFEINTLNIEKQGLIIDDEIKLMGGTVIDVTELYKNSQLNLRETEKKLKRNEAKIDSINKLYDQIKTEIARQESLIEDQKSLIESKKKLVEIQKLEIKDQLKKSNEQNVLIETQTFLLYNQRDSLKIQLQKLKKSEKNLKNQSLELIKGNILLKNQKNALAKMDLVLEEKTKELGKQDLTITKQKQILFLFSIVIFLIIVLVFVTFIMLRRNRRKTKLLNENKIIIEDMNQELQSSIEEIQSTNEDLHNKNDELISTLDKLNETQKNLIQSEKMASIGVLTAGIAHEMNNPINFVYAGVNLLKKDFLDILPILEEINNIKFNDIDLDRKIENIQILKHQNEYSDALEAIKQTIDDIKLGADRTAEIVKSLKNFARIDKEEWYKLNIHESLDDALVILKTKYKMRIIIEKNYDLSLPEIECYPGKLNQVFVNIISNAIDAIEDTGKIGIITNHTKNHIEIIIKNTGKEINTEIITKIFDPFFTTKKVGKGQGLGLSITYGIIKEHNGTIDVKSEKGTDTEFIIQLPIHHTQN